ITPRAITITADSGSKIYGDADPTLLARLTAGSLAQGDTINAGTNRAPGENVGSYAVHPNPSGNLAGNYTITYVNGQLTIIPRPTPAPAIAQSKNFGQADPPLTYKITAGSLAFSDTLSGSLVRDPGENVGVYAIRQGTLTAGSNYALTFVGSQLTIATQVL